MNRTELIALGEKLVKACLDYEKVDVGCWSVKGNGGLATEDENIEIIKMNKNEFLQYQFNDGKSIIAKLTFVYHLNCMQPKK